jgi:hypothetical protein
VKDNRRLERPQESYEVRLALDRNPIPRPPPQGGIRFTILDPPGLGGQREPPERTTRSRAGDEYIMVLQVSQIVVVGVTALGVAIYADRQAEAAAALDAWQAAADQRQREALRRARGG